ncbi:MAG: glycosyltransferase [Gemmataceae bacterium]
MATVFREHALAHRLLDGLAGLEIGAAAHNPFGLNTRNVAPPDDFEFYAGAQSDQGVAPARVDIWATADALPLADDSEDFVLSSHVVEHLPNVIATFCEWNRVVRVGGFIFMIVPLRDALPADQGRPLTSLEHFIEDYTRGHTLDSHPTDGVPGGRMGHYHVFTPDILLDVVGWMRRQRLCDWELAARENIDSKVGNGFTLVFRVLSKHQAKERPVLGPASRSNECEVAQASGMIRLVADDAAMREGTEKLADAERRYQEAERVVQELLRTIESEHGLLGARLLCRFRVLRNRLFPPGSRRWPLYLGLRDAACRTLRLPGQAASGLSSWLRRAREAARWSARRHLRQRARVLNYCPLISILTPVYNVERRWLRAMIESVRGQVYPNWELCLVDDASTAPSVRVELAHWAARDARVKVKFLDRNRGIAGASNECLAMAGGEFAALLDHDDLLTPDALLEVVELLNRDPSWDLIYSDEDKITASGACYDPVWKTGWNPSLLLSCNYITHLGVYRTRLLRQIDGFRTDFDGSQDYDLVLRFTEQTTRIAHIPRVLYHWRVIPTSTAASALAKPYAYLAGRRAIEQALQRRGRPAPVEIHTPGHYRVHHPVHAGAAVSLIVHPQPGADGRIDLEGMLRSTAGSWDLEYLVVTAAGQRIVVHSATVPMRAVVQQRGQSLTATLNEAVRQANSRHLVFLTSGVRQIHANWLIALIEQFQASASGPWGRAFSDGMAGCYTPA